MDSRYQKALRAIAVGTLPRDDDDDLSASYSTQFGDGLMEVLYVFEHVGADNSIERPVSERQMRCETLVELDSGVPLAYATGDDDIAGGDRPTRSCDALGEKPAPAAHFQHRSIDEIPKDR